MNLPLIHARIIQLRKTGRSLRTIHDAVPGATWATIADALFYAWWQAILTGPLDAR